MEGDRKMITKNPWKIPEGYNYPFFTSKKVAEILGMNVASIRKVMLEYATEVVPGEYLWTEENVLNMIKSTRNPGYSGWRERKNT